MAVLIASDLRKDVAGQPLLRGVSFKLELRERMTVAGRNGAGKTTLLRMLAGEESIDRGEFSLSRGSRVALHDQRPARERQVSLRDYVLSGCAEELAIEAELEHLERAMAAGRTEDATLSRYSRAQARLEARGGYRWRDRAREMVHGLGFRDAELDRGLDTFSGGQLTRASLARALATGADVLLLDEPTNHLDIDSLEWLEQTLIGLPAAVVLVAHDRWFLETVGTAVLELETGPPPRSRFFAGTWHAWRKEQAARELAMGRAIERQQAEIARLERFVDRFRAGTRARQAQARVKKLDRIERIDPRTARSVADGSALSFAFKPPERSGRVVFELQDGVVQIGQPPLTLLSDADLWLERGEHVSLVGPNGAGKTTLIETLAGRRDLADGKLRRGHNVKLGFLSQHADEVGVGGPSGQSVLEATQRSTRLTPNKARALLGRFLFSGEEAEKPLDGLSGGERRRLSLAILVHSGANVLILDEPTNHLDLESREALEDALASFEGSLLLVSHDRALLDAVGTRTVAVEEGSLRSYVGGWPEYVRVREERKAAGVATAAATRKTGRAAAFPPAAGARSRRNGTGGSGRSAQAGAPTRSSADQRAEGEPNVKEMARARVDAPSKNRLREQEKAERGVEEAEAALSALEEELGDPSAWASRYEAAKSEARHTAARRAVEEAYARLEATLE